MIAISIYNKRDTGSKIDLLNSNKSFFNKVKVFYDDYGKIKDMTSSIKSSILVKSETIDFSKISTEEKEKIKIKIQELKDKIEILKKSEKPSDALELYNANKELLELEATSKLYNGETYDDVSHFIDQQFMKYNFTLDDALKLTVERRVNYIELLLDKYNYSAEEIYYCLEDLLLIKDNPIFTNVDSNFKEKIYMCIYNELALIYYPNEINSQDNEKQSEIEEVKKHPHPRLRELYHIGKASVKEKKKREEVDKKKSDEDDKAKSDEDDKAKSDNDDKVENKVTEVKQNVNTKWRTISSIAIGVGIGAGVWFTFGAVGVTALSIGGVIAKKLIAKKQKQLNELKNSGNLKLHQANEFPKTLIGQLMRFKSYLNSPEGLDAIQKVLTSSVLSSLGFNMFGSMLGLEGGKLISAIQGIAIKGGDMKPDSQVIDNTIENAITSKIR